MYAVLFNLSGSQVDHLAHILRVRWPDAQISKASTEQDLLRAAQDRKLDLVLLVAEPEASDSAHLVSTLRDRFAGVIVALIGGRDEPVDAEFLKYVESGADDCVALTASPARLLARVGAALRRSGVDGAKSEPTATCGPLQINLETHEASIGDHELSLTPTEFKLLYYFARNHPKVASQADLHHLVWGCEEMLYVDTLRKHIRRLRTKLQEARDSQLDIVTLPRVGYRFVERHA